MFLPSSYYIVMQQYMKQKLNVSGGEGESSEWHDKAPQAHTRSEFIIKRDGDMVANCCARDGEICF